MSENARQKYPSRAAVELAPLLLAAAVVWSAPPAALLPNADSAGMYRVFAAWSAARLIAAAFGGWTLIRWRAVYRAAWRHGWRARRHDRWGAPSTDCLTRLGLIVVAVAAFNLVERRLPDLPLYGHVAPAKFPALSLGSLWNGEFATRFEARLAANLPGRGFLVRADNQLNYSVFGEYTRNESSTLARGVGDQIFERGYLDEGNASALVSPSSLREKTRLLARLQSLLADRGIYFLFLITPNKATIHPEYVAAKYRIRPPPTRPDAYRLLRPMLDERRINYLDCRELFLQWKTPDAPLFTATDIHWDEPAAYRVFQLILGRLAQHRPVPPVKPAHVIADAKRDRRLIDLADLANLLFPARLYALPCPHIDLEPWTECFYRPDGPKVTLVGGSFLGAIRAFFCRCHLAADIQYLYYYRWQAKKPADDAELRNLRRKILATDFVLVETNESLLEGLGFGFLEDAVRVLSTAD